MESENVAEELTYEAPQILSVEQLTGLLEHAGSTIGTWVE